MLTTFLKYLYKSKSVPRQVLENKLKNWNITQNKLSRTFVFYDFQQAMTFMTLAGDYVDQNQIKANM